MDWLKAPATEQGRAILAGLVSPVDLAEGYLDAIADAMVIFREAVDAALNGGSDAARWRQACIGRQGGASNSRESRARPCAQRASGRSPIAASWR